MCTCIQLTRACASHVQVGLPALFLAMALRDARAKSAEQHRSQQPSDFLT